MKKNNYLGFTSGFGCDSLVSDSEYSDEDNNLFNNVKSFVSTLDDRKKYVKQYLELKELGIPLSQKQENLIRVQQKLTNHGNEEIERAAHQTEALNEYTLFNEKTEIWQNSLENSVNKSIDEFEKMKKQWLALKQVDSRMLSSEQKQLLSTLETFFDMKEMVDLGEKDVATGDGHDIELQHQEAYAFEKENKNKIK